jgi:hypothetical protein
MAVSATVAFIIVRTCFFPICLFAGRRRHCLLAAIVRSYCSEFKPTTATLPMTFA